MKVKVWSDSTKFEHENVVSYHVADDYLYLWPEDKEFPIAIYPPGQWYHLEVVAEDDTGKHLPSLPVYLKNESSNN